MVLGYRDAKDYLTNPYYLGVIVGRVANRIGLGSFKLSGQTYELPRNAPPHTLHGGAVGLGRRNWHMDQADDTAVRLSYVSLDGEDGFPGRVAFEVTIRLDGACLSYTMHAHPDRPTPINLAQHSYYTLGQPGISELRLILPADRVTPSDVTGLPTGAMQPLDGMPWDFRTGRTIKIADPENQGIDQNFAFSAPSSTIFLTAPDGMEMKMETDQPGLQLYTAAHLRPHGSLLEGQQHEAFSAVCLEPQNFPDAINQPHFPNPIHSPDRPYAQTLHITIGQA